MRTRIGEVPDSLISVSLLVLFLILMAASVAGQGRLNLQGQAAGDGCYTASVETPARSDLYE